jgi:hypothetical protein
MVQRKRLSDDAPHGMPNNYDITIYRFDHRGEVICHGFDGVFLVWPSTRPMAAMVVRHRTDPEIWERSELVNP